MNHDPDCTSCPTCDPSRWQLRTNISVEEELTTMKEDFAPPDPYAPGIAAMRAAASGTPESLFAERYAAERTDAHQAEYAEWEARAAERPAPRVLSAAELKEFEPPDPYAAGIKALQLKEAL